MAVHDDLTVVAGETGGERTSGLAAGAPVVDRYLVFREIGRGAMGRVFVAYDPKLRREVALKEVRSGRTAPDASARLVQEARAMAKVSHPNVVGVYDAEVGDDGRVVLVMEYVAGPTMAQWLTEQPDPQDILRRFDEAGRGLAACHAVGLLHRDFKPSNVLIAPSGVARVTDFGLAMAEAEPGVTAAGAGPGLGHHAGSATIIAGTPRYMSPEQHRGTELTAAADQYAFCVALWMALCGDPPFGGPAMTENKMAGPPAWPRADTPPRIVEAIERGLRPQAEDRWPSMEDLLGALAEPNSADRARRVWVGSAWVAGVSLAVAAWQMTEPRASPPCRDSEETLGAIWNPQRQAEIERAFAEVDASYVDAVTTKTLADLNAYARRWVEVRTGACEATVIRRERPAEVFELSVDCLDRARLGLDAVAGQFARGGLETVRQAHVLIANLPALEACLDADALRSTVAPPIPAEVDRVESVRALLAQARAANDAADYDLAMQRIEHARQVARDLTYEPIRAEIAVLEGDVLDGLGDYERAIDRLRQALLLAAQWWQPSVAQSAATHLIFVTGFRQLRFDEALDYSTLAQSLALGDPTAEAGALANIGTVLDTRGDFDAATEHHRRALALREAALGPAHPYTAASLNSLGNVYLATGNPGEAEKSFRDALQRWESALGPEHPEVAIPVYNLAGAVHDQGRYEEAEALYRRALKIREEALGPEHPDVSQSLNGLANALLDQGKFEDAASVAQRAIEVGRAALGSTHPSVTTPRITLANVFAQQGRFEEAAEQYRAALKILTATVGPDHFDLAGPHHNLANVLMMMHDWDEAIENCDRALAIERLAFGPSHPQIAVTLGSQAIAMRMQGQLDDAEAALRSALEILERESDPNSPDLSYPRTQLAIVLLEQGRAAEAVEPARLAWEQRKDETVQSLVAEAAYVLARALIEHGGSAAQRTEARQLVRRSLELFRCVGPVGDEYEAEVEAWMKDHGIARPPVSSGPCSATP